MNIFLLKVINKSRKCYSACIINSYNNIILIYIFNHLRQSIKMYNIYLQANNVVLYNYIVSFYMEV